MTRKIAKINRNCYDKLLIVFISMSRGQNPLKKSSLKFSNILFEKCSIVLPINENDCSRYFC